MTDMDKVEGLASDCRLLVEGILPTHQTKGLVLRTNGGLEGYMTQNGDREAVVTDIIDTLSKSADALESLASQIREMREALDDYHFALDTREHGEIAADRLVKALERVFGQPWEQGRVARARSALGGE